MYKLKTSRSIKKRVKSTSTGKFLRRCSSRSHLLQKKTSKRKRHLRKVSFVNLSDKLNFKNSLPYI
uniref:50S ribosomal protein L35 n=1 Tax=Dasya binghamiae TaxID=1896963 RepID=A0A1C8XS57_9FLOR|nr:ribosomal protein L35 [Dasya binghamiae]AOH77319.1 ribosomal protein L35 [Dasya binghamiae]